MENTNDRVNKIIRIDKNIGNKLIKSYRPDYNVEKIERFTDGKSTSNYKVWIKGLNLVLVIRIYPQNNKVCQKEVIIYNKVKDYLPVPKIYYTNSDKQIISNAYSIVEYLDGITLDRYIEINNKFPESLAKDIGEKLALLHQTEFKNEGLLDENLNLSEGLPPILDWYEYFLSGIAGKRIGTGLRKKISNYIDNNYELLLEMTSKFVLTHGDFRPENLMIKEDRLVGILDWEFSLAAPRYFDIGQFFRNEKYLLVKVEDNFIEGYNSVAKDPLPDNWGKLSKTMDLATMLSFISSQEERVKLYSNMIILINETVKYLTNE